MNTCGKTISEMAELLRSGKATPQSLLADSQAQIEKTQPVLNAYLAPMQEIAAHQAERAARILKEEGEDAHPLCGIPFAVKDVLCVDGVETTASSKILKGFIPPYTATAVQRLLDAGAVPVGKTNCDEFAMGSSNENSAFGPVGNAWDPERVPGGSSGGSASAVASGTVAFSLGTDTGGSIRQPAALSGIVGFKPTYGRVSRYGLIAFASSLDQIGPFANSASDAAVVFDTIAGHDPRDATSSPSPVESAADVMEHGMKGMRIGVPKEYFVEGIQPGVRAAVEAAIKEMEKLGAEIKEISLPSTEAGLSTYYIIAPAECSSNLARFDSVRFGMHVGRDSMTETFLQTRDQGFGPEVKRRIMLGTYALSSGYYDAYYRQAQKVRTLLAQEFASAFEKVDALVCPTSPIVAFKRGEKDDPLAMYLCDVLTIPVNLAGLPGVSIPCGFSEGMPVGLQIIGPRFADARVLQIADAYERATEWHEQRAPIVTGAAS